jgi:hypothetical protein
MAGQAWQGIHPAGINNYYEPKSGSVSAISPAGGTATVNPENSPKNEERRPF